MSIFELQAEIDPDALLAGAASGRRAPRRLGEAARESGGGGWYARETQRPVADHMLHPPSIASDRSSAPVGSGGRLPPPEAVFPDVLYRFSARTAAWGCPMGYAL